MHVQVLVLDGVFDAGLALVLDTLDTANALASAPEQRARVAVVGVRRRVRTHLGFAVPVVPRPRARPNVIVVPALGAKTPDALAQALARRDVVDATGQLQTAAAAGARVTAACTATFVLGDAGLLAGRRATTTWWLAPFFRARFPAVALDEAQMVVESDNVVTAGSALAHLDLALWLVRRRSPTLARTVANHLLYDARPSQAPYVMPDHLAHADPLVARFEDWARGHLAGFTMRAAAQAVGATERTLERRVRAVLGKSPLSFVQDLRVAHAVHRLQTTDESLDAIAAEVGYSEATTLRTLLRRRTGRGVRELRRA
ncbi:GlxA family transcriptional regulator [Nannocystis pusilla]|uniref:GlxA family transcriptional regulator n=1 Tax=Nannocystis pusilla TaxID=889268 RepID=UPI003DA24E13